MFGLMSNYSSRKKNEVIITSNNSMRRRNVLGLMSNDSMKKKNCVVKIVMLK